MSIKTLKLTANSKAARTKDPVKRRGGEKGGKEEKEDPRLNAGLSTHTIHKETYTHKAHKHTNKYAYYNRRGRERTKLDLKYITAFKTAASKIT